MSISIFCNVRPELGLDRSDRQTTTSRTKHKHTHKHTQTDWKAKTKIAHTVRVRSGVLLFAITHEPSFTQQQRSMDRMGVYVRAYLLSVPPSAENNTETRPPSNPPPIWPTNFGGITIVPNIASNYSVKPETGEMRFGRMSLRTVWPTLTNTHTKNAYECVAAREFAESFGRNENSNAKMDGWRKCIRTCESTTCEERHANCANAMQYIYVRCLSEAHRRVCCCMWQRWWWRWSLHMWDVWRANIDSLSCVVHSTLNVFRNLHTRC